MRPQKIKPTQAELEILQVLWTYGPSTVRFVNEKLKSERNVGYTTSLKVMQLMTEKGILDRYKESRTHIYSALVEEKPMKSPVKIPEALLTADAAAPVEPEEKPKKKGIIKKLIVILLALVVLGGLAYGAYYYYMNMMPPIMEQGSSKTEASMESSESMKMEERSDVKITELKYLENAYNSADESVEELVSDTNFRESINIDKRNSSEFSN